MSQLRVMASYPSPRPTTNPYVVMLDEALAGCAELDYRRFSWRDALLWRYDVFHTHWTEAIMQARTRPRAYAKQLLLLLAVVLMRLRKVAIVRTVHNVELPNGLNPLERLVLRLVDGGTRMRIRINDTTPLPAGSPAVTILHGHYVDWYAPHPRAQMIPGRLGYFGLVRRYKGVESLIETTRVACRTDPALSLRVGGRPSTDELADQLTTLAADDPAIRLDLRFLSDAELVEVATESEVVVLPYRFMHNSGSVLAALSLDRPVLVPRNEANERLAAEVGPGWVTMFDGELSGASLLAALTELRSVPRSARPNLSGRAWDDIGRRHADAYRAALRRQPADG